MMKYLQNARSLLVALTLSTPQAINAMDVKPSTGEPTLSPQLLEINSSNSCHQDVQNLIVFHAAIEACSENVSPIKFLVISKKITNYLMNSVIGDKPVIKILQEAWYGVPGHEMEYEAFLMSVIRHRTHYSNNAWQDLHLIKNSSIPLRSEIQLPSGFESLYGMRVGIPKALEPDNKKFVTWLCPRFCAAKLFETTGNQDLIRVLKNWDPSVMLGVIFTYTENDRLTVKTVETGTMSLGTMEFNSYIEISLRPHVPLLHNSHVSSQQQILDRLLRMH